MDDFQKTASDKICVLCENLVTRHYRCLSTQASRCFLPYFEELRVNFEGYLCSNCANKLNRLARLDESIKTVVEKLKVKRSQVFDSIQRICKKVQFQTPEKVPKPPKRSRKFPAASPSPRGGKRLQCSRPLPSATTRNYPRFILPLNVSASNTHNGLEPADKPLPTRLPVFLSLLNDENNQGKSNGETSVADIEVGLGSHSQPELQTEETRATPRRGGKRCVAANCSNSSYTSGITMHLFPREESLRNQWTRFVQEKRLWDGSTNTSVLCSAHFSPGSFPFRSRFEFEQTGTLPRKNNLNKDAVPTIHFPALTKTIEEGSGTSTLKQPIHHFDLENGISQNSPPCKLRRGYIKRETARILEQPSVQKVDSSSVQVKLEIADSIASSNNVHLMVQPAEDKMDLGFTESESMVQSDACSDVKLPHDCHRLELDDTSLIVIPNEFPTSDDDFVRIKEEPAEDTHLSRIQTQTVQRYIVDHVKKVTGTQYVLEMDACDWTFLYDIVHKVDTSCEHKLASLKVRVSKIIEDLNDRIPRNLVS